MTKEKPKATPSEIRKHQGMRKLRDLHSSELEYFKKNPKVAGMATSDKKVILNPYSKGDESSKRAVYANESARLHMRQSKDKPKYKVTEEQKKKFKDYGSKQDIRETVAARLHANDSSAGIPTQKQVKYAEKIRNDIAKSKVK